MLNLALISAAATALTSAAIVPAHAESAADLRTAVIAYGDLDLKDAADARLLKMRVARAANKVCRSSDRIMRDQCVTAAKRAGAQQIETAIAMAATQQNYAATMPSTAVVGGN